MADLPAILDLNTNSSRDKSRETPAEPSPPSCPFSQHKHLPSEGLCHLMQSRQMGLEMYSLLLIQQELLSRFDSSWLLPLSWLSLQVKQEVSSRGPRKDALSCFMLSRTEAPRPMQGWCLFPKGLPLHMQEALISGTDFTVPQLECSIQCIFMKA